MVRSKCLVVSSVVAPARDAITRPVDDRVEKGDGNDLVERGLGNLPRAPRRYSTSKVSPSSGLADRTFVFDDSFCAFHQFNSFPHIDKVKGVFEMFESIEEIVMG